MNLKIKISVGFRVKEWYVTYSIPFEIFVNLLNLLFGPCKILTKLKIVTYL